MKVWITGAHGMVGKNLMDTAPLNIDIIATGRNDIDLCSQRDVETFLKNTKPDAIIHAAGKVGGIQANIKDPVGFLLENMTMGFNVIHHALHLGVSQLINLGSSCMYPKDGGLLDESQILQGPLEPTNEGYALAKISCAKLCDYISREKKLHYKTLIPCNLYGKWDKFDLEKAHLIPSIIKKIANAQKTNHQEITIWGTGQARREFMYAEDIGIMTWKALLKIEEIPNYLNIGLGYDYSILEYYQAVAKIMNWNGHFLFDTSQPEGMKQKLLNVSVAQRLGFEAQTSLHDGLQKTIQWYLQQGEKK